MLGGILSPSARTNPGSLVLNPTTAGEFRAHHGQRAPLQAFFAEIGRVYSSVSNSNHQQRATQPAAFKASLYQPHNCWPWRRCGYDHGAPGPSQRGVPCTNFSPPLPRRPNIERSLSSPMQRGNPPRPGRSTALVLEELIQALQESQSGQALPLSTSTANNSPFDDAFYHQRPLSTILTSIFSTPFLLGEPCNNTDEEVYKSTDYVMIISTIESVLGADALKREGITLNAVVIDEMEMAVYVG
jgi:hypothetical protein